MKRIFFIVSFAAAFALNGCIKNDPVVFKDSLIEFDAAIWNSNAAGRTYPILTRVPAQGRVTGASQPTLTRSTGTVELRVNLVGAQRSTPTNFTYQVVGAETTAVAGTHYTNPSGTGTIPANSSFGLITIQILNPGASTGSKILVLELTDSPDAKVSVNYSKVGLSISQS
ncbi:MAG TPA: hypothetical protein VFP97_13980 [Chitinophagaceae bacterium]|nr:hypothetical protein [Chitinophagaceae bacterium]